MNYFKIIQENYIIDIGHNYVKCLSNNPNALTACDIYHAQYALSSDSSILYFDNWMTVNPHSSHAYENATVIPIEEEEYLQLQAELQKNPTVDVVITTPNNDTTNSGEPSSTQVEVVNVGTLQKRIAELEELVSKLYNDKK